MSDAAGDFGHMSESYHIPVMLAEVLDALRLERGGSYVDGTLGGGGHAAAILDAIRGRGVLHAFDADPGAIANAKARFAGELDREIVLHQAYFSQGCEILAEEHVEVSGILLDLGVSSRQLDSDQIGLSYRQTMPLDMRFDPDPERPSARQIVNRESPENLATLLRKYGEEPAAWKIANAIVKARSARAIETTTDLREVIEATIPEPFRIKTLARVFQALRIAVNDELGELERALDCFIPLMRPGARFVILTYHSLEDRIVKEKFRDEERSCVCPPEFPVCRCQKEQRLNVITRKPLLPTDEEVARNPRARSAKLRVAERVEGVKGRR